jgi:hypothetical protein
MSDDDVSLAGGENRQLASPEQILMQELGRVRSELNTEARLTRNELHDELKRVREELHAELIRNRQEVNQTLTLTLEKNSSKFNRRDFVKNIFMPLLLVLIAALLATFFQDRSFKKNTLFQTQYERILSAQKEAIAQSQDLSVVLNTLKRWEQLSAESPGYCSAENFSPLVEQLKQFDLRSRALKDYSKESGNSVLDAALTDYSYKLGEAIRCESGYALNQCKSSCEKSINDLREASQVTIYKHNELLNDLISRSK